MTNTASRSEQWYRERIGLLADFMTDERYDTLCRTAAARTTYATLLTENTFHGHNAAAMIRHCEAFGLQQMHTIETLCPFEPSASIVRGTDRWVDVIHHTSTCEALAALKQQGYRIVATTPHRGDTTPEAFDVGAGRFALVFGTEHAGISNEVIDAADEFLRIPMCGMVESLNVSASAAILLYMLTQRLRQRVEGWQLESCDNAELLYRWMCESVADAAAILNRRLGDPL